MESSHIASIFVEAHPYIGVVDDHEYSPTYIERSFRRDDSVPFAHHLPSLFLRLIGLPDSPLDSRSLRNPGNPLQQMGERLHIFLGKAAETVPLYPWPCSNIGYRVFSLPLSGEILSWLSRVFPRKMDFKHAVHAEGFVAEPFNGV